MLKLVIGNRLEIMWQTAVLTTLSKGEGSKTKREKDSKEGLFLSHIPLKSQGICCLASVFQCTVSLLLRGHMPHVHSSKL